MDRVLPEGLLPDIPRIYTAIAEWVACMLFILPMKKRFGKIVTGVIAGGILLVQCGFLMATDNINIYLWIPCMMIAVAIMIGFIFGVCDIAVTNLCVFWTDSICNSRISGIYGMAGNVLLAGWTITRAWNAGCFCCTDIWHDQSDTLRIDT